MENRKKLSILKLLVSGQQAANEEQAAAIEELKTELLTEVHDRG